MRIDLHNHTTRCNHAEGSIDEYIQKAIELGIDIYGFSEHAPMDFDQYYRLDFNDIERYEADILDAKARYAKDIKIILGYEVDWLPNHIDKRVLKREVDYLIGSVHFINKWGFDNPEFIGEYANKDINEIWIAYFDAITQMAKSALFDIVGHLDLLKIFKFLPTKDIRLMAKDALRAIKESNMTIELNTAGLRKPIGEIYPSKALLQEAYNLEIPITFSSDAHKVEHIGYGYQEAIALAKEVGYTKAMTFEARDKQLVHF
ncbi:MAG TPA: histidinol-phosphatase HisJ family protein [Epsilonproteobacteria bacterium]|nr:histidinol-phosphatase HisJ family protein [Campylobacterota bacterium]